MSKAALELLDVCVRMPKDKLASYPCYDPRDPAQVLDDRTTWKVTDNAILITATMLHASEVERGRIDWDKVAALADLCEAPELGGTPGPGQPRLATRAETDAMLRALLARPRRASKRRPSKKRLRPDAGCGPSRDRG